MATGWAPEGAVLDQIDATVRDSIARARGAQSASPSLATCEDCGVDIPPRRRAAIPGVRLCVECQGRRERDTPVFSGYNRRGSKDSQLR